MAILTNRSDVIANFVRYHGRQPNASELAPGALIDYLTTKAPTQVEQLLAKNSPITKGDVWSVYQQKQAAPQGTTSPTTGATTEDKPLPPPPADLSSPNPTQVTGISAEQKKAITDMLDSQFKDLTPTERSFIEATFLNSDIYTSGKTVPTPDQIAGFIRNAADQSSADINPYYEKITAQELEDYKNKMSDIRSSVSRFAQTEAADYKKTLAETKQNLRARGLTFSGINRAALGKESAINAAGIEGTLPQNRRYAWEDKLAGVQEQARDIGISAERELGSTAIGNELGIVSPYDLKTGNLDYQAGRTQALYTPHQADSVGAYAGLNETPAAGEYTSTHELQRLKDIELAQQQRLQQKSLII